MQDSTDNRFDGKPEIVGIFRHAWERSRGSVSLLVVWICVGFFLGVALLDVLRIVDRNTALSFLGLSYIGVVRRLLLYQLLTAPLLHGGVTHLLFNMLTLWMLGPGVEQSLGRRNYIVFSLLCALASMAGSLLMNWGTGVVTIGYSGVIYGILVAQAMFFPDTMIMMFYFFPLKMKYAVLILGAVALYLTVSPEGGGIAHAAHLFGAAAAWGYLRLWRRRNRTGRMDGGTVRPVAHKTPAGRKRRRHDIPKEL
jgi:membrane associated rhomboid family serine protease